MSHGILARFYRSKRWQRCRDAFMSEQHYICERCGKPAVICHHIKYLNESNVSDPDIALSPDNLMALCMSCHDAEHNHQGPCVEGLTFDSEGNLVRT